MLFRRAATSSNSMRILLFSSSASLCRRPGRHKRRLSQPKHHLNAIHAMNRTYLAQHLTKYDLKGARKGAANHHRRAKPPLPCSDKDAFTLMLNLKTGATNSWGAEEAVFAEAVGLNQVFAEEVGLNQVQCVPFSC